MSPDPNDYLIYHHVVYLAEHTSGRLCSVYQEQVNDENLVNQWKADGWTVHTVTHLKYAKKVGDVSHESGVKDLAGQVIDLATRIASLQMKLREVESDRDTWKALASNAS